MRQLLSVISGLCVAAFLCVQAIAQDSPPASSDDEGIQRALQMMQQEMENLRKENQAMKGQIDELRAKTDADWLTEARANEIRGLVQDVLADADTRASLLQEGITGGWSDHFFLSDPSGKFLLVFEGSMQIRWVFNYHDEPDRYRHHFENTRTWLTFRGHVFSPDWEYLVRGDFSRSNGNNTLLDAWVRYALSDEWSLRFGQFKLPFEREELVSDFQQLAVERSLITQATTVGRSQGIELTYAAGSSRLSGALSDGASPGSGLSAALGGARTNTTALSEGVEYAVTARYEHLLAGTWDQFEDFTSPPGDEFGLLAGVAAHYQRAESTGLPGASRELVWGGLTADVSAEFGGANLYGAFTYLYVDSQFFQVGALNVIGVVLQAGVYVAPKWEVFVRGEYGQMDFRGHGTLAVPDLNLATIGVNYYIDGHDVKWTNDFGVGISRIGGSSPGNLGFANDLAGWRFEGPDARPQIVFRSQFQLLF
jgi:hypothetical protein